MTTKKTPKASDAGPAPVPAPIPADDRDSIFDGPVAETVEVVKAGAPPTPPTPFKPTADHVLVATWIVRGTEMMAGWIHPCELSTEEKTRGIASWAEALAYNLPDLKGGPILSLIGASVWSLGVVAAAYKARLDARKAGAEKPVTAEPVGPVEPPKGTK